MNSAARKILFLILLGAAFLVEAQSPVPLLEYHLDETGTMAVSVGSSALPLTFYDANRLPADFHSADALGISGLGGDRAFDNTTATAMGGQGTGGVALIPTNVVAAGAFSSFTLQCWFHASTPLAKAARLFDAGNYVAYAGTKPGVIWLCVNKQNAGTAAVYAQTNAWVFFAVSYDSTQPTNNVVFYRGTKNSPVVPVGLSTLNAGVVTNNHPIGLGNLYYSNSRPFLGLMDDVRIFGVAAGASGVLTQAQLEEFRQKDLVGLRPTTIAAARRAANVVNPAPEIRNPQHTAKGFSLQVQTVAGANYAVLASTNLVNWMTLTNFVGDGTSVTVRDVANLPMAFYRVVAN